MKDVQEKLAESRVQSRCLNRIFFGFTVPIESSEGGLPKTELFEIGYCKYYNIACNPSRRDRGCPEVRKMTIRPFYVSD